MKHVRSIAVIFATGLAAAGTASAQDMYKSGVGALYTGLNYTFMDLESGNADADVGTLSAKVGVMATPYLASTIHWTISSAATPRSIWPTNRRLRPTPYSASPGLNSRPLRSLARPPKMKRMCLTASV